MKKLLRILFRISFVIYLLIMFYYLFLKSRSGYWQGQSLGEYLKGSTNITPFKTIGLYFKSIINGNRHMNSDIPVRNLVGNVVLFLPFGIYLPAFVRKLKKPIIFTIAMLGILLTIEAAQVLTRRGSFDIDDIILNIIGAWIGLMIWKTKPIRISKENR